MLHTPTLCYLVWRSWVCCHRKSRYNINHSPLLAISRSHWFFDFRSATQCPLLWGEPWGWASGRRWPPQGRLRLWLQILVEPTCLRNIKHFMCTSLLNVCLQCKMYIHPAAYKLKTVKKTSRTLCTVLFEKAVGHVAQLYIKCKLMMLHVNLNWQLNSMP